MNQNILPPRRILGKTVFAIVILGILITTASFTPVYGQQPGSLDLSFDGDGKLITPVVSTDMANAVARQADGKLIVAGSAQTRQPSLSFGVMRMNQDGTLDATFDGDGKVTTGIGGFSQANAVAIQPDGKIVVAGISGTGFDGNFAVARYNLDGSLDATFDGDGTKTISLGYTDTVYSVLIQPNGKIILIGTAQTPSSGNTFALVRLNADGAFDPTFGTDGIVLSQVGFVYAGILQADGKIVAVGNINVGNNDKQIAVVRYNTDGSLDNSFGGDGKVFVAPDAPLGFAYAVALQPDGKLVVGGKNSNYGLTDVNFTLVRLNPNGSLDTTFDGDGKVVTALNAGDEQINALMIQRDGKILASGYSVDINLSISGRDSAFVRYNADGSLDTTFAADGILIDRVANEEDAARGLLVEPDGKIWAVGFRAENTARQYEFAVLKLNPDGSRDNTFSSDGLVSLWLGADYFPGEQVNALAIQADGKIVSGGSAGGDFTLARFNASGMFDTTFDGDGRVLLSPINDVNNQGDSSVEAVAIQPDGKIIAAGYVFYNSTGSNDRITVARFLPDGTLDATFDGDGKVVLLNNQLLGRGRAVVLQPDGKIVVVGEALLNTGKSNFFLARFNADGSLDMTFDGDGMVSTAVGSAHDAANAVALQSDGKIIAAGYSYTGQFGVPQFATVRYNTDGSLDASFDGDGKAIVTFGADAFQSATAVVVQRDGKIVSAGKSIFGFTLVRHNPNGSLDPSFGASGKVTTLVGFRCEGRDMILQGDGKIVMAGFSSPTQFSNSDFTLARYNSNGSLDVTFDADGVVTTQLSNLDDEASAVALQPDGKIVAAGKTTTQNSSEDFALVRFISGYAPTAQRMLFDFDGDGKSDVSTFRPNNGTWYLQQSTNGFTGMQFGVSTDRIVPADYDGDGRTDAAVFREGTWYLQRSQAGFTGVSFGASDDIPMPADYDGDGKSDIAVFRPSTGIWYIQRSNLGFTGVSFGQTGDKPVAADYDGDGKADVAVYRNGTWYIQRSQLGFTGIAFGESTDKPVAADYDGDGKTDVAVFRPSNGTWYLLRSAAGFTGLQFGLATDLPVPADYDGDGKTDVAVFRDGNWYLNRSSQGFTGVSFGATTDKPVPNAFVPQ